MSDTAAHELATTPVPVAPAAPAHPFAVLAYPLVLGASLVAHAIVLALLAFIPIPQDIVAEPEPLDFTVVDEAPPPPPEPVVEPPPPPPSTVAAVVPDPPRRRVRHEAPPTPDPEPAPTPIALTATTPTGSDFTQPGGDPEGMLGGDPAGHGTGLPSGGSEQGATEGAEREGISRAMLRRMLAGYIRDTLSRFLDGRIQYPLAARRERLEGVVVLRIRLARDGRILAVRLSRSSGHQMLDTAALASVQGLGSMPAPPAQIPWDDDRELPLPVNYVLR